MLSNSQDYMLKMRHFTLLRVFFKKKNIKELIELKLIYIFFEFIMIIAIILVNLHMVIKAWVLRTVKIDDI